MSEQKSPKDEGHAPSGSMEAAPELAWIKNSHFLNKYNMSGRTAVITGGGSGIGYACAAALCSVGAHVVITGHNEQKLQSAVAALQKDNGSVEYFAFDVSDPIAVRDAAKNIGNKHGKVHVLINNAGVAQSSVPAETVSDPVFDNVLKTNLYGKVAHLPMKQAAYNASKAALHHLSSSMAIELIEDNIRVNAVAPGLIRTDMTKKVQEDNWRKHWTEMIPMRRFAEPD